MQLIKIKDIAKDNNNFRKVLQTGIYSQFVAMSIPSEQDIGEEVHPDTDQSFFIIEGKCEAIVDGGKRQIEEGDCLFVPAGATHNLRNTGKENLKLITIYAPPHHPDGTIHATKEEALKNTA